MRLLSGGVALLMLALVGSANAGDPARDESRLRARLSPELTTSISVILDRARQQGLPTDPLVARALEGASREASEAEILAAVSRQADALEDARRALGGVSSTMELEAGASALLAGVPEDSLGRLRTTHPNGSLVVALVVMSDLVARGVEVQTASATVIAATRAGASDEALMRMREHVHQRIRDGVVPGGAAREGLRDLLQSLPGAGHGHGR